MERNKQFVMRESTKVTKKRNREIMIIHGRPQEFFQGGKVNILFIIFKLLMISVPSKIVLHDQIFVLVSMIILRLRKWSFQ